MWLLLLWLSCESLRKVQYHIIYIRRLLVFMLLLTLLLLLLLVLLRATTSSHKSNANDYRTGDAAGGSGSVYLEIRTECGGKIRLRAWHKAWYGN